MQQSGAGTLQSGPWSEQFIQIKSESDLSLTATPPESLTTFADEHPDSINNVTLFAPRDGQWVDLPAALHAGAGSFAFLDGHAELHAWKTDLKSVPVQLSTSPRYPRSIPQNPDIAWFSAHSAVRAP